MRCGFENGKSFGSANKLAGLIPSKMGHVFFSKRASSGFLQPQFKPILTQNRCFYFSRIMPG